jgi:hypothetical protein
MSNLTAGSRKRIITKRGIKIIRTRVGLRRCGDGAAVGGLREASETEGRESGERAGRREPLASL